MPRTDTVLNTGMSSSAARKVAEQKQQREKTTAEELSKIMPDAGWMAELIAKEQSTLGERLMTIVSETPTHLAQIDLIVELKAIQMYKHFLDNLNSNLNSKVKVAERLENARKKQELQDA